MKTITTMVYGGMLLSLALIVSGCTTLNPRVATKLNEDAALTGNLPFNPLQGKVITSWIDKKTDTTDKTRPTMSTLYGNDVAVQYARSNASSNYPAGSVVSLVTWNQREDERWFGGNIPASTLSVETVKVYDSQDHHPSFLYQRFEGKPLKQTTAQEGAAPNARTQYLLAQRAAVMP